jgi:thiamine-phosphate pyrophosphorylase
MMAISGFERRPGEAPGAWFGELASAGVGALQLREKGLTDRRLLDLAGEARRRLPSAALLIVNGRPDVAVAAGADGVHLPARGLPPERVREHFGHQLLVGCSTHDLEEVEAAREAAVDYVIFGPVWETPGKSAVGLSALRRAVDVGLPLYAIGGVSPERLAELAAAGAHGAAGIRLFRDRAAAEAALDAARAAWPRGE